MELGSALADFSECLVREFLEVQGFKDTLKAMTREAEQVPFHS